MMYERPLLMTVATSATSNSRLIGIVAALRNRAAHHRARRRDHVFSIAYAVATSAVCVTMAKVL